MNAKQLLLTAVSALVLAACTVGPDYKAPDVPATAAAPFLGGSTPAVSTATPVQDWWRLYDDPTLDGLVADALRSNTDIRVAVARLERARALLRDANAGRLPDTAVTAGGAYNRVPNAQSIPGRRQNYWLIDGGLSVSYEVDLFGRVTRSIEAADGDLATADADADAVRVAVVADTTRAYVDAGSATERLAVAQHTVDLLDHSLQVTAKRLEAGRAAKLDVVRIAALREQRAALVPGIAAERQAALFRLATLTGRTPQELPANVGTRTTTPRIAQALPVGDGAALLARRPDVRAAERQLAADTARIGVATADLYPRITLGGAASQTGSGFGSLFGGGALGLLLGPQISWAFPNQEGIRAKIGAAEADASGSLAAFDGTVLKALQETETALSTYAKALDGRTSLQAARDQAETAAEIVRARQREGQVDFLSVLDAERTAADTEADLAAADARIADDQIDLFRALGGGWQAHQVAVAAAEKAQ